jgi:hypothetical protein
MRNNSQARPEKAEVEINTVDDYCDPMVCFSALLKLPMSEWKCKWMYNTGFHCKFLGGLIMKGTEGLKLYIRNTT